MPINNVTEIITQASSFASKLFLEQGIRSYGASSTFFGIQNFLRDGVEHIHANEEFKYALNS